MECLEGETLADRLQKGALPVEQALKIGIEVCEVLDITEPELEKDAAFSHAGFSVAQNGALVFQSATDSPSRLIWFDVNGKELGQLPGAGYTDPQISPDGRLIAVSSDDDRNGKYFIRIHDLARGVSTRITNTGSTNANNNPVWSRDGKRITYPSVAGNTNSIYQIRADGSSSPQLLLRGGKMLPNDWSADGHLLFMDLEKTPWLSIRRATTK